MKEQYGEILIYQTEEGLTNINVKMQDETVWLTQQQLVELYQSSKSNVSEHIKHIFEEGELEEDLVVRKFRTTASDGKNYNVTYYNLDMIISLGYRIKSSMLKTDAVEKYPGIYWNALDWTEPWPEGESPEQFFQRIQNAWYEFKTQVGDETVL